MSPQRNLCVWHCCRDRRETVPITYSIQSKHNPVRHCMSKNDTSWSDVIFGYRNLKQIMVYWSNTQYFLMNEVEHWMHRMTSNNRNHSLLTERNFQRNQYELPYASPSGGQEGRKENIDKRVYQVYFPHSLLLYYWTKQIRLVFCNPITHQFCRSVLEKSVYALYIIKIFG